MAKVLFRSRAVYVVTSSVSNITSGSGADLHLIFTWPDIPSNSIIKLSTQQAITTVNAADLYNAITVEAASLFVTPTSSMVDGSGNVVALLSQPIFNSNPLGDGNYASFQGSLQFHSEDISGAKNAGLWIVGRNISSSSTVTWHGYAQLLLEWVQLDEPVYAEDLYP